MNRFQRQQRERHAADEADHLASVEKMSAGPSLTEDTILEYTCPEFGHTWTLEWPKGTPVAATVSVCFGEGHHWMNDAPVAPLRQVVAHIANDERFVLPGEIVPPMPITTPTSHGAPSASDQAPRRSAPRRWPGSTMT